MHHSNAKAIYPPLKLFCCSPFTDTTTYCLFPTAYVEGIELAIPGNWYSHNTLPVLWLNARSLLSPVAPMKINPPAVAIPPPRLKLPELGIPIFANFGSSPSGTCQTILPVFRSMAVMVPNGGAIAGSPLGSR